MANFNTSRFVNFGKYDYTINKSFYRNTCLISIFAALGIALIGFVARNIAFTSSHIPLEEALTLNYQEMFLNPSNSFFTGIFLFLFVSIMGTIISGYAFHNLRNKQGRITELTMPATNFERWLWHVLVVSVGGAIILFVSILCADLLNAILNLIVYDGKVTNSLTATMFRIITGTDEIFKEVPEKVRFYFILNICVSTLNNTACYIFGNSLKYKYNIILTYIAQYIIQTAITVACFTFIYSLDINSGHTSMFTVKESLSALSITFNSIAFLFTIAMIWGSYHFYSKAQITAPFNR